MTAISDFISAAIMFSIVGFVVYGVIWFLRDLVSRMMGWHK